MIDNQYKLAHLHDITDKFQLPPNNVLHKKFVAAGKVLPYKMKVPVVNSEGRFWIETGNTKSHDEGEHHEDYPKGIDGHMHWKDHGAANKNGDLGEHQSDSYADITGQFSPFLYPNRRPFSNRPL